MFSKIYISRENLLHNLQMVKQTSGHDICVMVKANAYGHGLKEIVSILTEKIDYFGVSNQTEALLARQYTDKDIIIFGKCEDYITCMQENISFALFSYSDAVRIVKLAKENSLTPKFHLCLNTGMNRYGIRKIAELKKIIKLLKYNGMSLAGIYTHFSSLTTDKDYTLRQKNKFYKFIKYLPNSWHTLKHVGGGNSIFEDITCDMNRVGLEVYGYGNSQVLPVMRVESEIVDIVKVEKNEHIGYLCGFTATSDMTIATIPLGYGDGLPRKLSNKLQIEINGKQVKNVGNICMDAFMADVSKLDCKIGDRVTILSNASTLAPLIESTEYEVLTNFSKFRGERIII